MSEQKIDANAEAFDAHAKIVGELMGHARYGDAFSAAVARIFREERRANKLEQENKRLRDELIPFLAIHAARHAEDSGLDGLHPQFYDRLKELGARMDAFKRAALKAEEGM